MVVTASRPHPPTGPASISLFQQACSLGCPGMVQLSFGLKRKLPNHHEDRKYYNRNLASILLFPQACPFGCPRMDQLSFGLECKLPLPVYLHRHGSLKLEQGQTASPPPTLPACTSRWFHFCHNRKMVWRHHARVSQWTTTPFPHVGRTSSFCYVPGRAN